MLAENATIVISGARIAREIGVSRSMVWQWVRQLRGLGVRVKGKAGEPIQLTSQSSSHLGHLVGRAGTSRPGGLFTLSVHPVASWLPLR